MTLEQGRFYRPLGVFSVPASQHIEFSSPCVSITEHLHTLLGQEV
jgi:hypothetical protein